MAEAPRWFLDANVLYPRLIREILTGVAERGLMLPSWSARVLDEWRIAAARSGGMAAEAEVRAAMDALQARFPDALVEPDAEVEASLHLPDAADVHVAAGAVAAGAETIVTLNLRDFPARRLAGLGLAARHPDSALWQLHSDRPGPVSDAIAKALGTLGPDARSTPRAALKRGGLPRLGKAWEAGSGAAADRL